MRFIHSTSVFSFAAILSLSVFSSGALAQGVFEGSGEEETTPSCVGDGCGVEFPNAQESTSENNENVETSAAQDSTNEDSTNEGTIHMDDEDDSREYYIPESHSEYQARKEGFSRRIQFGLRASAGLNIPFGDNDGWNPGVEVSGGIFARLPLTNSGLSIAYGLDFGYRRYSYEGQTEYSKDEATISQVLFTMPILLQYAIDSEGLFFGFGADIQLKMRGESEFTSAITAEGTHVKDKRRNTLPTTGVEVGLVANLGYTISSWCQVDLRATYNFTNLLDLDVIAESSLMNSKLHMLHLNVGVTFLL